MDLEKECMNSIHMLRIGDVKGGINHTLTIMNDLKQAMKDYLYEEKVLQALKNLVLYIENKDGIGLADVLEYEILDIIRLNDKNE